MELTPKVFRDVQFREKLRGGYHPEDVDEFLEQAALGVEALQDRLRQATERAQRAEQAATEATATDEALKRMLLMAQRTADQAVTEAREEADKLVAEARAKAESMLADAEERGRRAYESALADGRANMQKADEDLRKVTEEVEALRGWVGLHKTHLLSVLTDARVLVEKAGLLSEPPPVTSRGPAQPGTPHDGPAASPAGEAGAGAAGASAVSPDQLPTGEWDPRYLEDIAVQAHEDPTVPGGVVVQAVQAAQQGAQQGAGDPEAPNAADLSGTTSPASPDAAPKHVLPEDATLDERAMDSFFSDQDLGDERGLGRFRRRQ